MPGEHTPLGHRELRAPLRPKTIVEKEKELFEALQKVQSLADELKMTYTIQVVGRGKELTVRSQS